MSTGTWRHTSKWPKLFILDARAIALWAAAIFFPKLVWVAIPVTLLFIMSHIRNISLNHFVRWARMKIVQINGNYRGVTSMSKHRSIYSVAIIAASACVSASYVEPASAEFRIVDAPGASLVAYSDGAGGDKFSEGGANSALSSTAAHYVKDGRYENPIIQGFADDLPLPVIFSQILPEGWEVYYASEGLQDKETSWRGGRPLTDVLDTLAAESDIDIEADLDRRRLYVSNAIARSGKLSVAGAHGSGLATTPTSRRYQLKEGESLRSAVARWTKNSGYGLAWDIKFDFKIDHPAIFNGTIQGVISTIAESYRRQGVMRDVEWVFKEKNHVLVVRKYDRTISAKGEK